MQWSNEERTGVVVVADTVTGNNEIISTPYNSDSIIWDAICLFPKEHIAAPPPVENTTEL